MFLYRIFCSRYLKKIVTEGNYKTKLVMKNFVFAFLLFPLFVACNGQSKPEKENISDERQSVLSNEPENVPVHLNKVQFLDKVADYEKNPDTWVYRGDKPAIIDFYATWCGPCKAVAPILDDLAKEYRDQIYIYKIDTDQEQELAADFGIRSIPSLLFIPMNGQPQMIQGAIGKEEFKKIIDEFLLKE